MKKIYLLIPFIYQIAFGQYTENKANSQENFSSIHVLQEYIKIPSISGNEKKAGEYIKKVCKDNGLYISDFGNENGRFNFAASIYPLSKGKPNIIYLNHIDVVPEGNNGKFPPYSGIIKEDVIYGRGAFDNKGAAIMQLASIIKFRDELKKESDYNVTFLAVSCEETQCTGGIEYVADNFIDELNPVVTIGEGPTELTSIIGGKFKYPMFGVSVAHKRTLWLKLELEIETPGHSSITPLEYSNQELVKALNKLVRKRHQLIYNDLNVGLLKEIGRNKKGLEKFILMRPKIFRPLLAARIRNQPELFALYTNTITLTNIYTNNKVYNKVPNIAGAYLDCRLLPQTDEKEFLQSIKKTLKNDNIKITVVDSHVKTNPTSTNNIFYQNLSKAIVHNFPKSRVVPILLPSINDLGILRRLNIPSYACNPVVLEREVLESIHSKDEHLPIKALDQGTKVYLDFLRLMADSTKKTP